VDRRRGPRFDELEVRPIAAPAEARQVLSVRSPNQIGRPSMDGDRVAFHVVRGTATRIVVVDVAKRKRRVVRSGSSVQFLNPSLLGSRMLYVAVTRCRQELRLARPGRDRVRLRRSPLAAQDRGHEPGHTKQGARTPCASGPNAPGRDALWSTALGLHRAVVTLLQVGTGATTHPALVSLRR